MAAGAGRVRRGRDRHGRGLRGPLTPPDVPLNRSRAQRFDEIVLDAVEHLEVHWADELAGVEFSVDSVPPVGAGPGSGSDSDESHAGTDTAAEPMPLGRTVPATGREPARVVIYRRPIEARAGSRLELAELVHDVVLEHVAALLGLDPDVVDPPYEDE